MYAANRKFGKTAFLVLALVLLGLTTYTLIQAWFAPACTSWRGLGTWCLPIGFEGPFADYWANRSLWNARFAATVNWLLVSVLLGATIYFQFLRPITYSNKIVAIIFLVIASIWLLGSYVLNNYS